jgi:AraC-like DNA-binding protein
LKKRDTAGPPRGIVHRQTPDGDVRHDRVLPAPALRTSIAHFWSVAWALRAPFVAETLPHPSVHLVFERSDGAARAEVTGVHVGRFVRRLAGEGWVFGIKLRPGAFSALSDAPAASLRGRVAPIAELLGQDGDRLAAAIFEVPDLAARMSAAEDFLAGRLRPLSAEAARVRDLVERMERDHTLLRVEDAACALGVDVRSLERAFRRHVGATPKWVIRRYRLHEAAERLRGPAPPALAELAASLGYADQAHFARDFKQVVGRAPGAFVAEGRQPATSFRS